MPGVATIRMHTYRVIHFGSMCDYYPRDTPTPDMTELLVYENDETEGCIEFMGTFVFQETDLPITCTIEEFLFEECQENEQMWSQKKCQINAVEIYKRDILSDIQIIEDEEVQQQKIYFRVQRIIEIEQIGKQPFEKRRTWHWYYPYRQIIGGPKEYINQDSINDERGTESVASEVGR